jgi:hypothetical protein
LYEWTIGQTPGQWTRAVSGAPLGAAVAWVVLAIGLSVDHQRLRVSSDHRHEGP